MARISGVDLPRSKRIEVALTYIYGIGPTKAARIVREAKVDPDIRVVDLDEGQVVRLREVIDSSGSAADLCGTVRYIST